MNWLRKLFGSKKKGLTNKARMELEKGKPEREREKQTAEETPFRMVIDDTFFTEDGSVIVGTVKSGVLHIGDEVEMINRNGFRRKSVVKGIDQFNKKVDKAIPDPYGFGILLEGFTKDYVCNLKDSGDWVDQGDWLCAAGTGPLIPEELHEKRGRVSTSESQRKGPAASIRQGRSGDGTILGTAIAKGTYRDQAGSEKIGYLDPCTAPFRTYPGGKTGLLQGQLADQLIQMTLSVGGDAVRSVYGSMFDQTGDISVDLATKLGLSSTRQVSDIFHQLAKKESISKFLLVTTTMPFFLTYSVGKVIVLAEVEHELKLNALSNLLLNDPDFASVHSVESFEVKAQSLWDKRKTEVEEKKQWAVDFQKSRPV